MSIAPADVIARRLTHDRLSGYLRACDGNLPDALELYEWNGAVSAAFSELLCDVEVVVRNAIHERLTDWNERAGYEAQWYENQHGALATEALGDIARARERIRLQGKPETPALVVSELPFALWRFLLSNRYRSTLWPWAIRSAFPNADTDPRPLARRVGQLTRLRNQITYLEPIHHRQLADDLRDCGLVIGAVCSTTGAWALGRSRVAEVLAAKPVSTSRPPATG